MTSAYILSADIGASTARARLCSISEGGVVRTLSETQSKSGTGPYLKSLLKNFVLESLKNPEASIQGAVLGLPGKISSDRKSCAITYLNPDNYLSFQDFFDELNVENGMLLNDLECGTYGISVISDHELLAFRQPSAGKRKGFDRFLLGMPGSDFGLGIHLGTNGVMASEGGHTAVTIDPLDEMEKDIWNHLVTKIKCHDGRRPPLTYSHLISGQGIADIFYTLVENRKKTASQKEILAKIDRTIENEKPQEIENWAVSENHICGPLARETFLYYGRFLGRIMQSASLVVLPEAIYLGGNIVIATYPLFRESFLESFQTHDVHSDYLSRIPIYIVLCPSLNLEGATQRAALIASGGSGRSNVASARSK